MREVIYLNPASHSLRGLTDHLTSLQDIQQQRFKKREVIIRDEMERHGGPAVYYVEQGFVLAYSISKFGHRIIHGFSHGHALLPFTSETDTTGFRRYLPVRTIFFEALTEVTGYYVPDPQLPTFLERNPLVRLALLEQVSRSHRLYTTMFETMQTKQLCLQVEGLLLVLAVQFGRPHAKGVELDIPLTHQVIGDSLSMARETASRCLIRLKRRGLLLCENRRFILTDPGQFKADLEA